MRILLVEDDISLAKGMAFRLKKMGYQPEHCINGSQAKSALKTSHFDLMILDLGLPDGFATRLIRSIRKEGGLVPILVLTAQDELAIKLDALNSGADDFLVKPVDILELEARIRVLCRRSTNRRDDLLQVADIEIDLNRMFCHFQSRTIELTRREFMLLKAFMLNSDRILSRQQLDELSHGWGGETESNAIEVHIHSLRKKLTPTIIKTVRGVGYKLNSRYADK